MPTKAPLTSIECRSLSHLHDEIAYVQDALSCLETEETWDSIANALTRFAAICNGNSNTYPADLVAALRASSRPIISALNSERTRLSGTATDFLTTVATALEAASEPLIPHYLPALFNNCTRTNKVFLNRAKSCIAVFVEHTQAPAILHYCAVSITDKSISLRLAAAEVLLLCLKTFNPPDLEKEQRAKEIEASIRVTAVDANAEVRKVSRKIFDAYKILLPGRVQSFTDPLTPKTRKYLHVKADPTAARSQPPSRPASSQSIPSTSIDTHLVTDATSSHPSSSTTTVAVTQRPKHVRSASALQTVPPKRPMRAPTPEFVAPANPGARRVREEARRLRVDMPPSNYIPPRADTGPQRPMSASELQFPFALAPPPPERTASGPQRVIRPDAAQAVRTGPIRPVLFNFKHAGSEDGTTGEKKERVVGGARRVLRMPDPVEAVDAGGKGQGKVAAQASRPIRPRIISTSKSTPAVPFSSVSVKDSVKMLASSAGASSRPGGASAAARVGRTASATAISQATASSRTKTKATEKPQETRRSKAETKEKGAEKEKGRERTQSKAAARPAAPRPAPTVTMRDRTNRTTSKPTASMAKPAAKDPGKASAKALVSPDVPEAAESVSPPEVPLPESPNVTPTSVPARTTQTPPLIDFDAPTLDVQQATTPTPEPEHVPAPVSPVVRPAESDSCPTAVPLPLSRPTSDGQLTPPPLVDMDVAAPRTPTPEHRPRRPLAEVEQTPISALVASIQRGFFAMHSGMPLSPMREEEENMFVVDESDENGDGRVFAAGAGGGELVQPVEPLFSRHMHEVLHA